MSSTKGVDINGQVRWVWSDTHDIVLALMAEVASAFEFVPATWADDWRPCACVPDLAFTTAAAPSPEERDILCKVLHLTRDLAVQRGDVTDEQVRHWTLGEGLVVCDGGLRTDRVTLEQILEVIDAYLLLLGDKPVLGVPR